MQCKCGEPLNAQSTQCWDCLEIDTRAQEWRNGVFKVTVDRGTFRGRRYIAAYSTAHAMQIAHNERANGYKPSQITILNCTTGFNVPWHKGE